MALNGPRDRVFYLPALLPTRPGRRATGLRFGQGVRAGLEPPGEEGWLGSWSPAGLRAASSGVRRRAKVRQSGEVDLGSEGCAAENGEGGDFS
jgi:hypothetical protein